jgi:hypothetical protein
LVPDCNPFFEGCVSISRAGRHDLPNILFRGLLLPAAVLQSMCWLLCPGWLRTLGAAPDRWQRALPALGVAAGQSTTGWLVERAGPSAAFLAGGVAGVLLAVVLWVRRHTLAPVPQPAPLPARC